MEKSEELKAKGIDTIALVSVNDAFVLDAWSKSLSAQGKILMLADGSAYFTKVVKVVGVACLLTMVLWGVYAHVQGVETVKAVNTWKRWVVYGVHNVVAWVGI